VNDAGDYLIHPDRSASLASNLRSHIGCTTISLLAAALSVDWDEARLLRDRAGDEFGCRAGVDPSRQGPAVTLILAGRMRWCLRRRSRSAIQACSRPGSRCLVAFALAILLARSLTRPLEK